MRWQVQVGLIQHSDEPFTEPFTVIMNEVEHPHLWWWWWGGCATELRLSAYMTRRQCEIEPTLLDRGPLLETLRFFFSLVVTCCLELFKL